MHAVIVPLRISANLILFNLQSHCALLSQRIILCNIISTFNLISKLFFKEFEFLPVKLLHSVFALSAY
ncbi:hypothetical protein VPHD260_0080 [Vibrio phage D260]